MIHITTFFPNAYITFCLQLIISEGRLYDILYCKLDKYINKYVIIC